MVKQLEIKAKSINDLDLETFNAVCMVDTQPVTGNNTYSTDRRVDLV